MRLLVPPRPDIPHARRRLSPSEIRVLQELARHGGTDKEIAEALGVSRTTVNTHFTNMRRKLGVHNRTGVLLWAVRNEVVTIT